MSAWIRKHITGTPEQNRRADEALDALENLEGSNGLDEKFDKANSRAADELNQLPWPRRNRLV